MDKKDLNPQFMALLGRLFDGFKFGLHIYEMQEGKGFYLRHRNSFAKSFFVYVGK